MEYYSTGKGEGRYSIKGSVIECPVETTAKCLIAKGLITIENPMTIEPLAVEIGSINFPSIEIKEQPKKGRPRYDNDTR